MLLENEQLFLDRQVGMQGQERQLALVKTHHADEGVDFLDAGEENQDVAFALCFVDVVG